MTTPIVTETRRNGNPVGRPAPGEQSTPVIPSTGRPW
jgi:hypothetical protein